jgi:uncharacterized protein (TIGR00251 family)
MSALTLTRRERGVRFSVHVQPRASRSEVTGVHNGALRVRLQAPPVDGAANAQLVELLAESLGVPRRAVRIVSGDAARLKVVDVEGVAAADIERLTREQS